MKKPIILFIAVAFISILFGVLYSLAEDERIILTTYYPAPFGVYNEMRADKMSIGSGYRNEALSDGMLIINGTVGIGTSSPNQKLTVSGTGVVISRIESTSSSGPRNAVLELFVNNQGGDDPAGSILFNSLNGSSSEGTAASIVVDTGTVGGGNGQLKFSTSNAKILTERMRITADGSVGIGTTGPGAKLHLNQEFSTTNTLENMLMIERHTTGTAAAGIGAGIAFSIERAADGVAYEEGKIGLVLNNAGAAGNEKSDMTFWTNNDDTYTEKMRITYDGNVGIGTTNPAEFGYKLDIETPSGASVDNSLALTKANGYGGTYFRQYYTNGSDYGLKIGWTSDRLTINQATGDISADSNVWGTSQWVQLSQGGTESAWVHNYDWTLECPDGYYVVGIGQDLISTGWWAPRIKCAKL